jgi:peptidoglycan/LPS O-acetylase OafA/YrhL
MVASTMIHPQSLSCRVLELPPIRYVGRLSYGIYLWQQIFLFRPESTHWPFAVLQTFPYNYVALFLCAATSYYLLERPLIRVGHRLAPPATPGRTDIGAEAKPAPVRVPAPSAVDQQPAAPPSVSPTTAPQPEVS